MNIKLQSKNNRHVNTVKLSYAEHIYFVTQELQSDLEAEQVKVNSLTHMLVVVDENNGENATAALEDQLQVRTRFQVWCFKPSHGSRGSVVQSHCWAPA